MVRIQLAESQKLAESHGLNMGLTASALNGSLRVLVLLDLLRDKLLGGDAHAHREDVVEAERMVNERMVTKSHKGTTGRTKSAERSKIQVTS